MKNPTMSAVNGDIDGASASPTWTEFCEKHAAEAARDFARSFRLYLRENPHYDRPGACVDFANKFVDYFLEHFEAQTLLKHLTDGNQRGSPPPPGPPPAAGGRSPCHDLASPRAPRLTLRSHTFDGGGGAEQQSSSGCTLPGGGGTLGYDGGGSANPVVESLTLDACRDYDHELQSPKQHKSFFRRFSFRGIRSTVKPLKQLFKQNSDEVELSSTHSEGKKHKHRSDKADKARMTKMIVECVKEGVIHLLVGEDANGQTKWEKCRLVLIKTTGGYMLEFYTPPKVSVGSG